MPVTPIRSTNAYIGLSKQTVQGTAVAPSLFPRWIDSSMIDINLKVETIREGDGTRHVSQMIKNQQYTKVKLVCLPRPVELGFLMNAALGLNTATGATADSITTTSPSTTLTSSPAIGATSCTIASVTGFPANGTLWMLVSAGTANAEVVKFSGTATTTLNVSASYNGGLGFKNAHSSGDSIAAVAAVDTSVQANALAGATQIILNSNSGLTAGPTTTVLLAPGTATEEVVTLATPGTGTGPWTYTVANNGTLKFAHTGSNTAGDTVLSPVAHVLTDQTDGAYYTVEVGIGSLFGGAGPTIRVRDCKVDSFKLSSKAGMLLQLEIDFVGIASIVQASPATVTQELHPPFYYDTGAWTLDGVTTGDAALVESFAIDHKNALDTTIQSEQLTLDALIFSTLDVALTFDCVFTVASRIYNVYFGNVGTLGTVDAQAIGAGSLALTFTQVDTFHSVTYLLTTLHYSKSEPPTPKLDGKHYKMSVTGDAVSNQSANASIIAVTVKNGQAALY